MSSPPLAELTVRDLTARLASRAPVPGGGSASALAGALGAALVEMVCELTVGKPEYEEVDPVARQIGAAAAELRRSLLAAAEEDAAAYLDVVAARRLPRESDEERAARKAAIGEASVAATEVPLRVAHLAARVLDLAASIASIGNRNAASDAGAAALLAAAAARGAALNVRINLPSLPDAHPLRAEAATQLAELDSGVTNREAEALAAVSQRMSA
ncbi:MAG TPA: cyclodeaminase/cyclohydrolase family protein [Candidatus Limnocylindria bacterium]|jgi:formiminotetrahydrofolate cyclodeaminase